LGVLRRFAFRGTSAGRQVLRVGEIKPKHPSVHLKKVGRYWSARVGLHHRAVAIEAPDALVWFWIGPHREYEKIVG
jgi:hypothetical protein